MLISPSVLLVRRVRFETARQGKHAHQQQHDLIDEISFFEFPGGVLGTCSFNFRGNRLFFPLGLAGCPCGARAFFPVVWAGAACRRSCGTRAFFLVVWARAACRAPVRRTGVLSGRLGSCGCRAPVRRTGFLSGRLGWCGLPGALAAHGRCFWSFALLRR